MPRVREIEDPGDDPILNEIFPKERDAFGFLLNTTKVQAHTPGIMKAAKQLSAAVSSTSSASPKWARARANSASSTRRSLNVIASAYWSATRSRSEKRGLVAASVTCRILSSDAPACIPRDALMSIQKGQPLIRDTRR